ncbi:hypothetical protein HK105_205976 [Polyrhizophydium stewartii]|uniref:F-box domain-containing protein n=1 Tax=Polyrhizophydium stewartii TaxID=2732419 RepID=A0ABR4N4J3_9FUNG
MPTQPQPCYVAGLPDELLVHVFSNLDADEMRAALGVCRRWKSVISDDHCWKLALRNYFGSLPLRRVAPSSWRTEYLRRLALARAWRKSKQGVQFEPRIGRIDEIFVDSNENRVFVASLQKGMASIHSSATGRSERAAVHASDDQSALEVGAIKIDKMRVAIGYLTGQVALMSNIRDKQRYSRRMLNGFHHGPVISLAWLPGVMSLLLSGSVDGQIRIWDVDSGECVRVLTGDDSRIVHIAVDQHNHVVASTGMGNCLVWDIDLMSHVGSADKPGSSQPPQPTLAHAPHVQPAYGEPLKPSRRIKCSSTPITHFVYDPASSCVAIASAPEAPAQTPGQQASTVQLPFNDTRVSRVSIWNVATGAETVSCTGSALDFSITSLLWDRPGKGPSLSGSSTLVSGNASGSVRIWTIPDLARAGNVPECVPELVKPVRTFVSLHLAPITALFLDEAKLVTASGDGKIKIIDILTGEILRQLAIKLSRSPWMDMDDESHQNVRCLWASSHTLIATAGGAVKFWSFEPGSLASTPNKKKRNSRGATRMGSSSTLGGSRAGRIGFSREDLVEIDDDVHQIRREIDAERTELAFMRHQFREFNGAATSDMSEEEMLRLALLMSADQLQEDERRRSMWGRALDASPQTAPVDVATDTANDAAIAAALADSAFSPPRTARSATRPIPRSSSSSVASSSRAAAGSGGASSQGSWQRRQRGQQPHRSGRPADEWDEDDDDADQFGDSTLDPELAQYISPGMRGATGHALAAYMEDLDLDARSGSAGSAGAGARRRIGGGS